MGGIGFLWFHLGEFVYEIRAAIDTQTSFFIISNQGRFPAAGLGAKRQEQSPIDKIGWFEHLNQVAWCYQDTVPAPSESFLATLRPVFEMTCFPSRRWYLN